ncbi:MAG: hypothetical protein LBM93_02015 [Oscillospiraceae bacterium]|nr:hypothetical protein [Oscillospiraceae bacterium]
MLFELKLMQGSEEEDDSYNTIVAGIMTLNEDGSATYETADNAENPQTINLTLKQTEEGLSADITSDGDFTISPDGHYDFIEGVIEVSEASAVALLEHLPTAATSLNSNNGEYTINYPDELISEWFYSAEAVFNDTGDTLAKFLIAKNLSAVFRVDDDIEPIMIYGSAQPMMDAYVMDLQEDNYVEEDETDAVGGPTYVPRMLVQLSLPKGANMQTGTSDTLEVLLPYNLPYTLTAESEDDSIVTVDENNNVTAVAAGETFVNCTITCEDGVAIIGLMVYVTDILESENYTE